MKNHPAVSRDSGLTSWRIGPKTDSSDNNQRSYLINYDYDPFGNRRQKQEDNSGNPFPQTWTEASDIAPTTNRLTNGVIYDDAGNVETDQKYRHLKFEYDANNRQKQSSNLDDTGAVKSIYDAAGQRVATQIAGALTNVLVYDAIGRLVAEYGNSSSANGTQYVMADHQGSTRVVLNKGGNVVSRHDYLPFGEEVDAEVGMRAQVPGYNVADGVRQKYAGMETDDATRLAHTLWRQYDSVSGRWTAPDPYGGSMTVADPQSFNRYSYVNNDPVNLTDPLGLMAASVGWTGASAGFWGNDLNNFDPHFGGPAIIGEAMAKRDALVQGRIDGKLALKYLAEGNTSAANRIFENNSNVGRYVDGSANWGADAVVSSASTSEAPPVQFRTAQLLSNDKVPMVLREVRFGATGFGTDIATLNVETGTGPAALKGDVFTVRLNFELPEETKMFARGPSPLEAGSSVVLGKDNRYRFPTITEAPSGSSYSFHDDGNRRAHVDVSLKVRDIEARRNSIYVTVRGAYNSGRFFSGQATLRLIGNMER